MVSTNDTQSNLKTTTTGNEQRTTVRHTNIHTLPDRLTPKTALCFVPQLPAAHSLRHQLLRHLSDSATQPPSQVYPLQDYLLESQKENSREIRYVIAKSFRQKIHPHVSSPTFHSPRIDSLRECVFYMCTNVDILTPYPPSNPSPAAAHNCRDLFACAPFQQFNDEWQARSASSLMTILVQKVADFEYLDGFCMFSLFIRQKHTREISEGGRREE